MSVFALIKSARPSKVHYLEYIRTENKPEEDATPSKTSEPSEVE